MLAVYLILIADRKQNLGFEIKGKKKLAKTFYDPQICISMYLCLRVCISRVP